MIQLNIRAVKNHLAAALAQAEAGETVIICRRNKPVAALKALAPEEKPLRKRPVGLAAQRNILTGRSARSSSNRCLMTCLRISLVKRNEPAA